MAYKASERFGTKAALASVLAVALAVLPGCTDPETRADIDQQAQAGRSGLDGATHPSVPPKHYNPLVVSDKVWAGNSALRMHRGLPLPARFETARGVTVVSSEPMSLTDIVNDVSQQTGIVFHLSADAAARSLGASAARPLAVAPLGSPSPMPLSAPAASSGGDLMPIAYEGPLSGLLERLAGHFGINWRYDGATISMTRYETRVFAVEALPGTQTVSDGMQDLSSGSSGSGGSASGSASGSSSGSSASASVSAPTDSLTQTSKFSIDIKYWEELEKVVNSMLAGAGTVVVSPSLGTITVTTTPEVMRTVADYLAQENQRMSRQIAVNVEVYSVSLTRGMDFNIAFNTALKRLADFGANFAGAPAPGVNSVTSSITGGGALSLAILNPNNAYSNEVTDVFTALSGIGDTTKVARFPLVTLNNRPVSRRIGTNTAYVASSSVTSIGTGLSTVPIAALTPGTIQEGFSVQVTPRLLDDGRILLQYSLSIQDMVGTPQTFTSGSGAGSSSVQLPITTVRDFVQQSVLKSGSTLILGGAEEDDAQQDSQGVLAPDNYALGGGISSGRAHTMVFFALTPQVLDVPHTEQD